MLSRRYFTLVILNKLDLNVLPKFYTYQNGQETHGFFKHVNTFLQIHAKVHIGPVNALSDIFFLLQDKHMVVEELLQLFIAEVDANLLKTIVVKDLKTSNVEATNV